MVGVIIIVIIGIVVWYFWAKSFNNKVKKRFAEKVTNFNAYIKNLEFKPTSMYVTREWVWKSRADKSLYSQASKDAMAVAVAAKIDNSLINDDYAWVPIMGVLMDTEQKLFAIRSNAEETTSKIYRFSQLQSFAVSEDIKSSRVGGAVSVGWVTIGGVAGAKGNVSLRIVISGTRGHETIDLKPELIMLNGEKALQSNTDGIVYKTRCAELVMIADCLQWIMNNA